MDANGTVVAKQAYWPYGAVRAATGVAPTDRLYTGQRQEPPAGDALGLYDYRARFYSTLVGRFVSADPVGDGLNRYAYAGANPVRYVDPTGETANIACGTEQSCESGDIGGLRNAIIQEWIMERRYPGSNLAFLNWIFDRWLTPALQGGMKADETAATFGLAFLDTGGWGDAVHGGLFGWDKAGAFLDNNALFGPSGADIWIGYSMGGGTVLSALVESFRTGRVLPVGAVLIEPAVRGDDGELPPGLADAVRIITIRDPGWTPVPLVHRPVYGVYNIIDNGCGGDNHCLHGDRQALLVTLAHMPGGGYWDAYEESMMHHAGVTFSRPGMPGRCAWYVSCIIL